MMVALNPQKMFHKKCKILKGTNEIPAGAKTKFSVSRSRRSRDSRSHDVWMYV